MCLADIVDLKAASATLGFTIAIEPSCAFRGGKSLEPPRYALMNDHLLYSCLESDADAAHVWEIWLSRADPASWSLCVKCSTWSGDAHELTECCELPSVQVGRQIFDFVEGTGIAKRQSIPMSRLWTVVVESLMSIEIRLAQEVDVCLAQSQVTMIGQ